jgi:hypothetical protein
VVIETIFVILGWGETLYNAVLARDYPLVLGLTLVSTFLFAVSNLIINLLYTVAYPMVCVTTDPADKAAAPDARRVPDRTQASCRGRDPLAIVGAASREAVDLLRTMRPAAVNKAAAKRDLAERETVILCKTTELAQALFSHDHATSHTDPTCAHRLESRERRPRPRHCHQPRPAHLRPDLNRRTQEPAARMLTVSSRPRSVS